MIRFDKLLLVLVTIFVSHGVSKLQAQRSKTVTVPWREVTLSGFGAGVKLQELESKLGKPDKISKKWEHRYVYYFFKEKLAFECETEPINDYLAGTGALIGRQLEYKRKVIGSTNVTRKTDIIRSFGTPTDVFSTAGKLRLCYSGLLRVNGYRENSSEENRLKLGIALLVDFKEHDGNDPRVDKFILHWSPNKNRQPKASDAEK